MTRKIEAMELRKAKEVKSIKHEEICNICETSEHSINECPHLSVFKEAMHEQVNAIEYTQKPYPSPYSNTYNPNWRNHPNFSWKNDHNAYVPPHQRPSNSSPYDHSRLETLERTMHTFIEKQEAFNNQTVQTIADLKDTLAKFASALSIHEKGKFPSQPLPNPKIQTSSNVNCHMDQVNSIILNDNKQDELPKQELNTSLKELKNVYSRDERIFPVIISSTFTCEQEKHIHPILDSKWINPIEVVPKKSMLLFFKNEKGTSFLTRALRKINAFIRQNLVTLSSFEQNFKKVVDFSYYYFFVDLSGFYQILIARWSGPFILKKKKSVSV